MQSGFSTSTCRPAASASSTVRAWVAFGAAMTTASSPGWRDRLVRGRHPHRDAEPIAHPLSHRPAGIGDHGELEPVAQKREVGQVHGLADQAGADHRNPLAISVCGHAAKPIEQVAP